MIPEETVSKAAEFGPAIAYELRRANELRESGLFTEATLRLGRAVEASLFATAREFEVSVVVKSIQILANLSKSLRDAEVNVMRKKSSEEVRSLSNVSKRLSEAIARLTENESARHGNENDIPRGPEEIFRDILQVVSEPSTHRRLKAHEGPLREILDARNAGAHPSLTGQLREVDKERFGRVAGLVDEFLGSLLDIMLGERARKTFATTVDV
jgi:hypothetical protein